MIKVTGTIQIKKLNGSRGEFSVGNLVTSIGTFKVKENILDQYDVGSYTGEFTVSQIFPSSYGYRGKVITELRMVVTDLVLFDVDADSAPAVGRPEVETPMAANDMPEPDPIDEVPPLPVAAPTVVNTPPVPAHAKASNDDDADAELFGLLHEQVVQGLVRLDTTIHRTIFRAQRERLKTLGFRFHVQTQTWERSAA